MTTNYTADDPADPPLHPVVTERIPYSSWQLAGMETLPPGYVNVRIWSFDERLGRDLYTIEECPGRLHLESSLTETVIAQADPDENIFSPWGDPWDDAPVVMSTDVADPPHKHQEFADPEWRPAYAQGGYLGTCQAEMVTNLLAVNGFPDAIPRPLGHVDVAEDDL